MITIYKGVKGIKLPEITDIADFKAYSQACDEYERKVIEFCKKNSNSKLAGERISIPHADGAAVYIVFKLRPFSLINLQTYDAWHSPLVEYLTPTKVKSMVDANKKLKELFG